MQLKKGKRPHRSGLHARNESVFMMALLQASFVLLWIGEAAGGRAWEMVGPGSGNGRPPAALQSTRERRSRWLLQHHWFKGLATADRSILVQLKKGRRPHRSFGSWFDRVQWRRLVVPSGPRVLGSLTTRVPGAPGGCGSCCTARCQSVFSIGSWARTFVSLLAGTCFRQMVFLFAAGGWCFNVRSFGSFIHIPRRGASVKWCDGTTTILRPATPQAGDAASRSPPRAPRGAEFGFGLGVVCVSGAS